MGREYDFDEQNEVGKEGENFIRKWLFSHYHILDYEDVSENTRYQGKDVDAIITLKNGEKRAIEIKTDNTDTGNLFYETISNEKYQTLGCLEKTEADVVLYLFTETKDLFILKMPEFRDWFHNAFSNDSNEEIIKPLKRVKNVDKRTRKIKYTLGHPVLKSAIKAQLFCVVKENVL